MLTKPEEQLLQAAYQGNLEAVKEALQQGARVDAAAQFGDTALNQAAEYGHLEVVKHLLEAGATLENKGGADKTPLMNATFAGHVEVVQFLLDKGARVSNDLLSSLQVKVNILEENAEAGYVNPQAAEGWRGFLDFMVDQRIKQDIPEIVAGLSSRASEELDNALQRIDAAASRAIDLTAAVPALEALLTHEDAATRRTASRALAIHHVQNDGWSALQALLDAGDVERQEGAVQIVASAPGAGIDISPLLPTLITLLSAASPTVRHNAAAALGGAAINHAVVSAAVPSLAALLTDSEPKVRSMATWALYRIAKQDGDISVAVPALQALLADEDEELRKLVQATLAMAG